jgi:hypothetical protein
MDRLSRIRRYGAEVRHYPELAVRCGMVEVLHEVLRRKVRFASQSFDTYGYSWRRAYNAKNVLITS